MNLERPNLGSLLIDKARMISARVPVEKALIALSILVVLASFALQVRAASANGFSDFESYYVAGRDVREGRSPFVQVV